MSTHFLLCDVQHAPSSNITSFCTATVNADGVLDDAFLCVKGASQGEAASDSYDVTRWQGGLQQEVAVWDSAACFAHLRSWLSGDSAVVTYDFAVYKELLRRVGGVPDLDSSLVVDCAWLSRVAYPDIAEKGLLARAAALGCETHLHEDGAWHAIYTLAKVYEVVTQKLSRLPTITLQVIAAAVPAQDALQRMIDQWIVDKLAASLEREKAWKVIDGLAFLPVEKTAAQDLSPHAQASGKVPTAVDLLADSLTLFRTSVTASADFPIEQRSGQERMMQAVASTLVDGGQLVVEAGTGTGKSLAYLLPAALYAERTQRRVVVSTHTIALQEQLRQKDLTLLSGNAPVTLRSAILKGRTHYLCMRKLSILTYTLQSLPERERDVALSMTVWLTETVHGDREELALAPAEQIVWSEVQSESESCIHKRCPFFRDCFYFRARTSAGAADIVVTNHSLVLSDLAAEHNLLPPYEHLIIDEAHHLEDQATRQLGAEVDDDTLRRSLERLGSSRGLGPELRRALARAMEHTDAPYQPYLTWIDRLLSVLNQVVQNTRDLFQAVTRWTGAEGASGERRIGKTNLAQTLYSPVQALAAQICENERVLAKLLSDLDALRTGIELDDVSYGRTEDVAGAVREVRAALAVVADVLLVRCAEDSFVGWVAWRIYRNERRMSLHLAPLSVAAVLRDQLFANKATVICTSATLSIGGDFSYFAERIGLTGPLFEESKEVLLIPSPFRYKEQSLLCVPTDLPEAKDALFERAVGEAIRTIAHDARGRTLVLFTSNQMLANIYRAQRFALQASGLRVLAQGIDDHRRSSLVDTFRREEQAVLFGVNSFWEGIDIRGDDLRCLIIVKLPFAVPTHPVAQARAEVLARAGKSPFHDYSVPQAVIRFTQGFGRLIRSEQDRGAVFVLDKRIVTTKYGRLFTRSLPGPRLAVGPLSELRVQARAYY